MSAHDDAATVAALDSEYQAAVDFVLIGSKGKVFTKDDLLAEARRGNVVYEYQRDTNQKVRVWGDTAVITAMLEAKGTEDGAPFDYTLWFSDTYVRMPDGWRYVLGQASTRMAP
jgi:ketosteroid isomerase-like protein